MKEEYKRYKNEGRALITDSCENPVNVPQPIKILSTDTAFPDSPDAGPECLCSRCGKAIEDVPIVRAWAPEVTKPDGTVQKLGQPISQEDTPRTYNYKFSQIGTHTFGGKGYKYHPACLGAVGHESR